MTMLPNDTNPTHSFPRGNSMDFVKTLGPVFATRAEWHDADDTFVADNYAALKGHRAFSLDVPSELGGGGATRAGDGYRITARKAFASGCGAGDMLVTSVPYEDPNAGPVVLHFPVSLTAEGITLEQDWRVMGMRGTGSHTVVLDDVYVPESALVLSRPRGEWHPVWNVI